jgi:hypothetical protein
MQGVLLPSMDCITCHESHLMISHNRLKLTVIKPFKKFHAFMESRGSVTEIHHFALFWDGSVHFLLSRLVSLKFILLLSNNYY